jgi:voltage-gated potassium channel
MSSPVIMLRYYVIVLALVLTTGVVGFILIEGLSPLDSIYLTIITISTVGYGDITAKTEAGKILEIFVILAGVGTFIFVIANSIELTLGRKEAIAKKKKVNMIVGVFFSEAGIPLIRKLKGAVTFSEALDTSLLVQPGWSEQEFSDAKTRLGSLNFEVDIHRVDLSDIHQLLRGKRTLLVQLLQHPVLFEHEAFTDLLNAVFHLEEELSAREDFGQLPESDLNHLAGDTKRVVSLIVIQWLDYMLHLKTNYPYLFSLAVRTNPFDAASSAVVR